MTPVALDLWEGFIFINLDPNPSQTLSEFLGNEPLDTILFLEKTSARKWSGALSCSARISTE